ncbi:MAG TPA: ankyrin repeat domain-containing protein [Bryobacteraceae bacterium]|nr:ankyrin repeat domain-containing protein [Bryobacteraceae bacterium]
MKGVLYLAPAVLLTAALSGDTTSTPLFQAIRNNDLAYLRTHLQTPSEVNSRDDRGATLLMHAVAFGSPEAVRLLLDRGANVSARNAFDATVLQAFGPPARSDRRIARSLPWIEEAKAITTDDHAMRLMGLYWGGGSRQAVSRLGRALAGLQRADGGWAQNPNLSSDAFATGETLWALRESGIVQTSDVRYRRGTQYLLKSQRADGSWYVRSRAPKFQPYFQSGFPYDHDQWISSAATGWATVALAESLIPPARKPLTNSNRR